MKKIAIIAFILVLRHLTLFAQTCPTDNLFLNSQAQVNLFPISYPGCQVISGDVHIGFDSGAATDITDLTPLSQITTITGTLRINNTSLLQSLAGLENLDTVGQTLLIRANTALTSLDGFDHLSVVGGDLFVDNNNALQEVNGLNQLARAGNVTIQYNANLNTLNGLNQLQEVGSVEIFNNALTNLNAFANLEVIDNRLSLYDNPNLANLNAFGRVRTVGQYLDIEKTGLTTLSGLDSLRQVGYSIRIGQNPALTNLAGLGKLDSAGIFGLNIFQNSSLTSLEGLGDLSPYTNMSISYNPALTSLAGLTRYSALGSLEIGINNGLTDMHGLDSLRALNGFLWIHDNAALTTLQGLENLHEIRNSSLRLEGNPLLSSISNLQNLISAFYLNIVSNAQLTSLNGLQNIAVLRSLTCIDNPVLSDLSDLPNTDSLQYLQIKKLPLIANLNDFNNLHALQGLLLQDNALLSDITSLQSADSLTELTISGNTLLSDCSIYPVCRFLLYSANAVIHDNGTGCNNPLEVAAGCGGATVYAAVLIDHDGDCVPDSTDTPLEHIQVSLNAAVQLNVLPTQADGWVQFGYLDTGAFTLRLPNFPTTNWGLCQDSFLVDPLPGTDSITRYFLLQPVNECPELSVELGLPPAFRGCLVQTAMNVTVNNIGTAVAEDVTVALVIPSALQVVSAVPPVVGQSGDTLFFALGALPPFGVQRINLMVQTVCDSFLLGQSLCLEALGSLSNPCTTGLPEFSEIRLFSQCVNDTMVRFLIKNVGNAPTQGAHDYVIIEDEIIMLADNFSLGAFGSMTVDVPSDGSTYRMEATKFDNGTRTATVHEHCGGFTPGFVTAYWFDQSLRNYDFDCREVNLAYDPNQKTAVPAGIGQSHLITANSPMEYTIEFQNTGTDTAYRVLLVDYLSPMLDLNTFRPGYASHPYTWAIRDSNKLEVLFSPIALPDSNVNEAASHGFFRFSIGQQPNLPDGTTLKNTASIVFDFNPPIVTNTVVHTIGKLQVSVDEPQPYADWWQVKGNPTRVSATFTTLVEIDGEKRFVLADAMGKTVRTEQFSGQTFEFQRGVLAAGVYFFAITDAQGRRFTGKIVIAE